MNMLLFNSDIYKVCEVEETVRITDLVGLDSNLDFFES
jgi:hypothetical protein